MNIVDDDHHELLVPLVQFMLVTPIELKPFR